MNTYIKNNLLILFCLISFSLFGKAVNLTFENDCFLPTKAFGKGDHDYTHGTCFEVINGLDHLKLGQNMYAPADLTKKEHIKGDRPYAGILYGGLGREMFFDEKSAWSHYAELDFGIIGPSAHCKQTQKLIHKWLDCKDPKGWDNQLHDEPVLNVQWWTKYNWYICDYVALVPRAGVLAGTIQDAVEVGCDLKVGWNLKNDVGNNLMFSAAKSQKSTFLKKLSAYAYIGADERYYLYNHFLEGSMFGHRDNGLGVDIEPFVGEIQCGACIQYDGFFIKYYMVFRQDEFKHQKNAPNYGGLSIGFSF